MTASHAEIVVPRDRPKVLPIRPWRGDNAARTYLRNSKASNTLRGYERDFRRFRAWCEGDRFVALPATPLTLVRYVTARAEAGRKIRTIRREVAAVAFAHKQAGLDSPAEAEVVKTALRGIARTHGSAAKQAPPILRQDLAALIGALDVTTNRGARDAAMLLTGWTMALRRSELLALDLEDVELRDRGVVVTVRRQKNDQEGVGYRKAVVLAKDPNLCTTMALRRWLRRTGMETGPLFRPVYNGDRVGHRRVSDRCCDRVVKRAAKLAGLEEMRFSSHSLRAGFVTQAAQDGKAIPTIQQQTGHKSLNTLMGYVRRAVELGDDSPTAGLL